MSNYLMAVAGEFLVAGELMRRGLLASVTYGAAKQTDVVAFSPDGERHVVVEVKSTRPKPQKLKRVVTGQVRKWVVGKVPTPSSRPWVFVFIPEENDDPPRYYVATQLELNRILAPRDAEYRGGRRRDGQPFGAAVWHFECAEDDAAYRSRWDKIADQLRAPTS